MNWWGKLFFVWRHKKMIAQIKSIFHPEEADICAKETVDCIIELVQSLDGKKFITGEKLKNHGIDQVIGILNNLKTKPDPATIGLMAE